jgi:hypothetical protein
MPIHFYTRLGLRVLEDPVNLPLLLLDEQVVVMQPARALRRW